MTIINSLKRLERAGSEFSTTNVKLKVAAQQLSDYLAELLPQDLDTLPRGYRWQQANDSRYLSKLDSLVFKSRNAALEFAADLASGWLEELEDLVLVGVTGNLVSRGRINRGFLWEPKKEV